MLKKRIDIKKHECIAKSYQLPSAMKNKLCTQIKFTMNFGRT